MFIADKRFKNDDFTQNRLQKAEYENCIFEGCNFSDGYLDNQNFMECEFIECNLSNANLAHTIFKEVSFLRCKMMGLKFEECNDLFIDFTFEDCALNLSSFFGMNLKNQIFKECKLPEVDFTEATLASALFKDCDLDRAIFNQSNLEKVDFRTAKNFDIDPTLNRLYKARFTPEGLKGLLQKHQLQIE